MMMKYKDFKMLSKDDMKMVKGGNPSTFCFNCGGGAGVMCTAVQPGQTCEGVDLGGLHGIYCYNLGSETFGYYSCPTS